MAVKSTNPKAGDNKSVNTKSSSEGQSVASIFKEFYKKYKATTPRRLRILDAYLVLSHSTHFCPDLYHVSPRLSLVSV
ncbi:unnamed protein product [Trichobilharzia szidati]|nr:unnamed protein product [Trichobilharzia szidati]